MPSRGVRASGSGYQRFWRGVPGLSDRNEGRRHALTAAIDSWKRTVALTTIDDLWNDCLAAKSELRGGVPLVFVG